MGLVVALGVAVSALLFYFGWVYTDARARYFGIDPSMLGYSAQEYIFRSIDVVFLPLGAFLIAGLLLLWAHSRIACWMRSGRRLRLLTRGAIPSIQLGGLLLFVVGALGITRRYVFGIDLLVTPLSLALGIAALAYGTYLRRRLRPSGSPVEPSWLSSVNLVAVTILVLLSLFWTMGDWAQALGRAKAHAFAEELASRRGVVVSSKEQLPIDVPGSGCGAYESGDAPARPGSVWRYGRSRCPR
ncbi:MAG: hypothetical protein ACRDJF_10305 [Actinomycetota bacterium]